MTKNFPHLTGSNPNFPGFGDPYAQGDFAFDYNRWVEGTKIILCRVPWDASTNVVDWTQTDPKDYFDNLQDTNKITLSTEINIQPDGVVRIPIPIANVQRYNYLWVELEPMTSTSQPLDYSEGPALHNIGYFLRDASQITPSTTECHLDVDWWTNSIPYTTISYMTLERGHAPLAAVTADKYLKDPLHNNQYLLTEDVNFGEPLITKHSQLEMWTATTEPLVCFALTCSLEQLAAMLEQKPTGTAEWTDPEFSDTQDRWGKQWQVNSYEWGDSARYKNSTTESSPWLTGTGLPGYTLIAVNATDADDFLAYIQENSPQIMQLIKTSFAVPAMMLSTKEAGKAGEVTYYQVLPLNQLPPVPVELKKTDFGYPKEYEDLAKLYTSPYAKLTFSDNDGHTVDVRIECTSGLKIDRRVSLAFPYLKAQAFLEGVNGTGSNALTWVDVNGLEHDSSMPATNWTDTMLSFEIPTYALVADGYRQWLLKHSRENEAKRIEALNGYHNTVRSGNTGTENTRDSLATSLKNTLRSNQLALDNGSRSNETSNTNTLASLTTGNTNSLASNKLALENGTRSNDTGNTNTIASIENGFNNTNSSLETERHNSLRSNETGYKNALASADTGLANEQASAATSLSNTTASAGTAYQNAENAANTTYQNTKNSADAGLANTLASNATAKANGDRSNSTSTANTLAAASTGLTNANRSADAARKTITNSTAAASDNLSARNQNADKNYSISKQKMWGTNNQNIALQKKIMGPLVPSINLNDYGIPYSFEETDHPGPWWAAGGKLFTTKSWSVSDVDGDKMRDLVDHSNTQTLLMTKANQANWYTSQIAQVQGIQSAATSLIESVASAASIQNPAAGNYAAPIGAAIGTARVLANTALSPEAAKAQWLYNTNETFYDLAQNYATMEKQIDYAEAMNGGTDEQGKRSVNLEAMYKSKEQGKAIDKSITTRNNILASTNGDLAQATSKANAAASNQTTVANANRTSDTTSANLTATKTTADSNANRSYSTSMTNAGNSKDTSLTNAENTKNRTVENAQASNATTLANAKRSNDLAHSNAKASYDTAIANINSTANTGEVINAANKKTSSANQSRSYTTTKANLAASKTVADSNANRSYKTGTANQERSYETTSANLTASKTTADANANDANATSVANAGYSQDTAISVAQNNLRTTQAVAKLAVESHKNDTPVTVGETTGDPIPDLFGTRGVQVRVQTQPEGAIRSAGSQFLRYGYRLDQAWSFEKWSVMSRFSYWQARDVWLTGETSIAELGKDAIRAILAQGVTVWASPEIVCTGSTTDNKPIA